MIIHRLCNHTTLLLCTPRRSQDQTKCTSRHLPRFVDVYYIEIRLSTRYHLLIQDID